MKHLFLASVATLSLLIAAPPVFADNVIVSFTPDSLGKDGSAWINPDTYQKPLHSGLIRLDVGEHAFNSGLVTFKLTLDGPVGGQDCVFTRAYHDNWPIFKTDVWGWDRDHINNTYTVAWAVQGERLEPGHYPIQYVCVDRPADRAP
jgi:hypothetical protein